MGIGTRDEETGIFFKSPGLENGHWYLDDDGYLYIVPNDNYDIEETAGPDNETVDALNALYREKDFDSINPDEVAEKLGLEFVHDVLRRFDPQSGFYTA
jgi:hypothetical protein